MKKLVRRRNLFLVFVLILIAFITKTYLFDKNVSERELKQNEEVIEQDMDYTKKMLENREVKVKRVAKSISNEIEIIVLKETGCMTIFHDRTPENNKYIEWIVDSNITLDVHYTAILTIDTKYIQVKYNEITENIDIVYDLEKINVKSVNIDNIFSQTSNGIFGEKYSANEVSALTLMATDKIKEEILNCSNLKCIASINLEGYLRNLSYSLGVLNVDIFKK